MKFAGWVTRLFVSAALSIVAVPLWGEKQETRELFHQAGRRGSEFQLDLLDDD